MLIAQQDLQEYCFGAMRLFILELFNVKLLQKNDTLLLQILYHAGIFSKTNLIHIFRNVFFPLSASNKLLQITLHCSFYCSDKSLKQHLKILESVDSRSLTFGIEIRTEKSLKAATILNTREEKKNKIKEI